MAVAIIGPIIGALLSSTLPKIWSLIEEKIKDQPENLKNDVNSIKDDLASIQRIFERGNGISNQLRVCIADLRRVAYEMEDCMDSFEHPGVKTRITPKQFGDWIREIKKKAESARERLEKSTPSTPDGGASSSNSGAPREDWSIPPADHPVVGLEKPLGELRELVRDSTRPSDRKLKVISIVGFGGLGKTLLAKKVYWDRDVGNQFPRRACVTAAGKSGEEVLQEILDQLLNQVENAEHGASTSNNVPQVSNDVDGASTSKNIPQVSTGVDGASTPKNIPQVSNGVDGASTSNNIPQVSNGVDGASTSKNIPQVSIGVDGASTSNNIPHVSNDVDGASTSKNIPQVSNGSDGASTSNNIPHVSNGVDGASTSKNIPQVSTGVDGASTSKNILQVSTRVDGASTSKNIPQVSTGVDGASTSKNIPQISNGVGGASTSNNALLRSRLGTNRYLIVIDDVRTEELFTIISAFPQDIEVGSRIIVTTTIQSVAKRYSSRNGHVYTMRELNDRHSKDLFFQVACEGKFSDAMENDASAVLEICDGLPLALVSIAQFLVGSLTADRCNDACLRLCARPQDQDPHLARVQRVLDDSYYSLSSRVLQECLLYFSMFPRGHHARRDSLIRRWLAEGLVRREGACSDQDVAVRNFGILIDRNIIQPIQGSNNADVKRCRPPGTMLKYISNESISENFMLSCDGTPQADYIRRLSLHHYNGWHISGSMLLQHLRTLAVFPRKDTGDTADLVWTLAHCKLLRVLDLEECDGLNNSHLEEICDLLLLLKYLSLGGRICKVPRKIAELKCLETLDLRRTKIEKVPLEVIKLPRLKHLLGKFGLRNGDVPYWMGNLRKFLSEESNLETLAGFLVGKSSGFPELMIHMRRLRKVKIWCKPTAHRKNLTRLSKAIKGFIRAGTGSTGPDDRSLSIHVSNSERSRIFLDSLHDPESLTALASLKLSGELSHVPQFVTTLAGIKELSLSSTTLSWHLILDRLSNLNVLKYLKLVECNPGGDLVIGPNLLRSLERICLVGEQGLPQITIQDGALPFLASLHLLYEYLADLSGIQIRHLEKLKEVALHSGVAQGTKNMWNEEARGHPNRPTICYFSPHSN